MSSTVRSAVGRRLPRKVRRAAGLARAAVRSRQAVVPVVPATEETPAKTATKAPVPVALPQDPPALVDELSRGGSLVGALVRQVRELLAEGRRPIAESMATSLLRDAGNREVGALLWGVIAFQRGLLDLAWHHFGSVPRELWLAHAAGEYAHTGLIVDRAATVEEIRDLVGDESAAATAESWNALLGPVFGSGEQDLARDVHARLHEAVGDGEGVTNRTVVSRDWMQHWVAARGDSPSAAEVEPGHVSFAIMDYQHPTRGWASANIGDHIQSLASLGHLVRHQDLSFHGPQDLVDLLGQLRSRVRPEMQRHGAAAQVDVLTVDRDASMYNEVPPRTWALAFGWYMHAMFEMRHGFPFHENLLPIFVSFHCNQRQLLTPEAIAYLRAHGPIGCRDWTTVDVLLSVGVPAFFSGCLTTTVSTVFPELPAGTTGQGPVAYVDMPEDARPADAVTYAHSSDAIRTRSFATNVLDAVSLLERYRRDHSALVTSRLHCYLPSRSIGVPVDFLPANRADTRFAGLIDITDDEFDAIRDGINGKLEQLMSAILAGGSPEEVYALWARLTADDVAAAERRRAAVEPMPAGRVDLVERSRRAAESAVTVPATDLAGEDAGEPVHVVIQHREDRAEALTTLLDSLVEHASRALHVTLLVRGEAPTTEHLPGAFPEITFTVLHLNRFGAGVRMPGRRRSPRELELMALAELMPEVPRAVLLPVEAVVTGDVAELHDADLGDYPFAAVPTVGTKGNSGFGLLHSAAGRLRDRTVAAAELRRRAHGRHAFDFDAFGTDVLVLSLEILRKEGFLETYLPYVEEFGLRFRELMHFAFGPDHAVLPARWHVVPTRSVVEGAALVHWADPVKPWSGRCTPGEELWQEAAQRASRRPA